jgi:peptidoglycan/LPS O-acetylase OafA/YrhL
MKRQFVALDGLRGVAALAVLFCHAKDLPVWKLLPGAALAVDLFFVLSGFVLAHAYEDRLRSGMSAPEFMLRRYIRLWPLYAVASAIGLAAILLEPISRLSLVASVFFGAFLLPVPHDRLSMRWTATHPFVMPAWSLFWELVANLIFALLAPILSSRVLGAVIALGAVLLVGGQVYYDGFDKGFLIREAPAGLCRVIYTFFAGVAVYRLWKARPPKALPVWLFPVGLATMLVFPFPLLAPLVGFPALVYLAASSEPSGLTKSLFAQLGLSSYAVYVLHEPILYLARQLGMQGVWAWSGLVVAIVVLSLLLDRLYDAPVRRWLERVLLRPWLPRRRYAQALTE